MTRFSASNRSTATMASSRTEVWQALTDPSLLPQLTPYLERIDVDETGRRWTWYLTRIPLLGTSIGASFTEVMTFSAPERIDFHHDPQRSDEQTEVRGVYRCEEDGSGTRVRIDLEVTVELPFPRAMRLPVQAGMGTVMAGMGRIFARNLARHLGER